MGKGEIARYEQFLLFPQCFQKACFPGASKGVVVWEWVKGQNAKWHSDQMVKDNDCFLTKKSSEFCTTKIVNNFNVNFIMRIKFVQKC